MPRMKRTAKSRAVRSRTAKVRVTICLDADVLAYFKGRAKLPNSAPYQTQINHELRAVLEREVSPYAPLLNDDQFIAAIAARVAQQAPKRRRK